MFTIIAMILAICGAINWLSIGIFNFNAVSWLLGAGVLSTIVYILVGLAGIYLIFRLARDWHRYSRSAM